MKVRLIDAEALKKALKDAHINMKLTFDIATFNCVMNTVDNASTVEPEITEKQAILFLINNGWLVNHDKELRERWERPQGEWKYHKGDRLFLPYMECSNCKVQDLLGKLTKKEYREVNHFCFNCGAKMKGGKE